MAGPASIRPFAPGDEEACRRLWAELTQVHRDLYDDPTFGGEDPGLAFDGYLAEVGAGRIWVAEAGGTLVGLAGLLVDDERAELEPIVVAEAARGQGVGRALAEAVIAAAAGSAFRGCESARSVGIPRRSGSFTRPASTSSAASISGSTSSRPRDLPASESPAATSASEA